MNYDSLREDRKQAHIENYLLASHKNSNLFEDVYLEHSSISEYDYDDINTKMKFLGKEIGMPFMINAITGGGEWAYDINESLALIAKEFNIPMAVGSQKIAIDRPELSDSFKVVREVYPEGLIFANLGTEATIDEMKIAIDMINADAIQIHLNLAQELVMEEGDRNFKGTYELIEKAVKELDVPVIVKEVGNGIQSQVIKKLYDVGVRYVDISGKGGTNFIEIEDLRDSETDYSEFYSWGIPTALAIINADNLDLDDLFLVSSGGITTASEICKSIILGADMCAGSGEIIKYLLHGGYDAAYNYVKGLDKKLRISMMLLNAGDLEELSHVDFRVIGRLREKLYQPVLKSHSK